MSARKIIAGITALAMSAAVMAETFDNYHDTMVSAAENEVSVQTLPDWVPRDLSSAVEFLNKYGTSHAEGDYVCLVHDGYLDTNYRNSPVYTDTFSEADIDKAIEQKLPIYNMAVFKHDDYNSNIQVFIDKTEYSFKMTDEGYVETDIFSWLPDCETEYVEMCKDGEKLFVRDGKIIFLKTTRGSAGYSWITLSGDKMLRTDLTSDCDTVYEGQYPSGGPSRRVVVMTPVSDGYIDLHMVHARIWEIEDTILEEIHKYFKVSSSCTEIEELSEIEKQDPLLPGDTDGNGVVDLSDLTLVSQYLLKDIELKADQIKSADVNADDEVNIQDLALLKQYVMHDDVKLGVSKTEENTDVTLVNIVNIAAKDGLSSSTMIEEFYKDEDYIYAFPSIISEYIECTFSDGSVLKIRDALEKGLVSVSDLKTYDIMYWMIDHDGNYISSKDEPEITELKSEIYRFGTDFCQSPDEENIKAVISSAEELEEFLNSSYIDKQTIRDFKETDTSDFMTAGYIPSDEDLKNNVYLFFTCNASYYETPEVCTSVNGSSISINVRYHQYLLTKYLFRVEIPKSIYNKGNIEISEESVAYPPDVALPAKPVIYLYPEETTDINVKLNIDRSLGDLTCTYPVYNEKTGWNVTAEPDSTLHDASGREYSYLFWEGVSEQKWDMTSGFVVRGCDTAAFLQEKLEYLGLTPREYNEFIVYWLPQMQNNKYNLISFQTDKYEEYAPLEITPEPDCIQRVFMTYMPLDKYTEVPEQQLEPFERHGYSVIEWGGTEISSDNYAVR